MAKRREPNNGNPLISSQAPAPHLTGRLPKTLGKATCSSADLQHSSDYPSSPAPLHPRPGADCQRDNPKEDGTSEHIEGEDPFKLVHRLDALISRMAESCKEKPDISYAPQGRVEVASPRELEERVDKIIQRLTQRSKAAVVHAGMPCDIISTHAASSPNTSGALLQTPPMCASKPHDVVTPTSSSHNSGLFSPRALFSRSNSAEKADPLSSPSAARLQRSRSGRLASALSFLSSPKRSGITRLGSPKIQDVCIDK